MSGSSNNKKSINNSINNYNAEFLQCFWDLANENQSIRVLASKTLLEYLYKKNNETGSDVSSIKASVEYALNRLVRGLASSREAARQGFALCLCEMFRVDDAIDAIGTTTIFHKALEILDSNTKITGSMKGSEERDNMFGKLFCYISILKSDRITNDEQLAVNIFDRIIELHNRKGWIREITTDAILLFISTVNIDIVKLISPKISLLLNESLLDMTAWQIMLQIGLQNIEEKSVKKHIKKEILSSKDIISMDSLNDISLTLLAATAGFPKLHRVWDFILSFVFPMDGDRFLQRNRLTSFSSGQEESLTKLIQYIEKNMISGSSGNAASKEKRSVAMSLALIIVKLCPPDFIPVALSKTIVKSIYSSRVNKKHALNNFAGIIINDLVSVVGSDAQCRLALASAFVQFGGANFDSNTNTKAVSTLLEGLDSEAIISHIKFLCSVIGNFNQMVQAKKETKEKNPDEDQDDDESIAEDDGYLLSVTSAIEALSAIAKNSKISGRGTVCSIIIGVFLRLSCFEDGSLKDETSSGKKGKKKNKNEFNDDLSPLFEPVIECVKIVEESTSVDKFPRSTVANMAAIKLLSLLSDIGADSFENLDNPSSGKPETTTTTPNVVYDKSVIHFTLLFLKYLINSGLTITYKDDQHNDNQSMKKEVVGIVEAISAVDFIPETKYSDSKSNNGIIRLISSLKELISHSLIHTLATEGFDIEAIVELKNYSPLLVLEAVNLIYNKSNDDKEDESEEENSFLKLFETCMDFMSLASDYSIKSIRDSVKKVWNSLSFILGDNLHHEVIDAIISVVVGEDSIESDQDKNNEDDADNMDQSVDSDEENEIDGNTDNPSDEKVKDDENEEEEEEEDILLNEEDVMDFLGDSDKDSDDNPIGMLQHSVEHDEAFAHMIEMRKQHRKQGIIQAKRNEMLIRSRAIDILEIILNRLDSGDSLFPMFLPLLQCLNKANSSALIQNISEGKSYVQRMQSLIQKLCKKKFQVRSDGDQSSNDEIFEEYQLLNSLIKKLFSSTYPNIRQISQICFLSLSRVIISSDCNEAKKLLIDTVKELFNSLCSKKNSRIVPKLFEELLINRFSDFFTPVLFNDLLEGIYTAKSQFIKSELCKILMSLLKKYKNLESSSNELVKSSHSILLESLLKAMKLSVETKDNNSNTFKLSAKRAKPILQAIKMILDNLNHDTEILLKNKDSNILNTLNDLSQLLTDNSKSASPVIEKLVENIIIDIKSLIIKLSELEHTNGKTATKVIKNKNNSQSDKVNKRTEQSIEKDPSSSSKIKNKKSKLN